MSMWTQENELSLRDYFAAMAMQGIISASGDGGTCDYIEDVVSYNAYKMADEMMEARSK